MTSAKTTPTGPGLPTTTTPAEVENPIVETEPTHDAVMHDAAMYAAVRTRLAGQTHRFLTAGRGGLAVHVGELAVLVAEIAGEIVAEYTDHLIAERDALAEDLAWQLNATHAGTERGVA